MSHLIIVSESAQAADQWLDDLTCDCPVSPEKVLGCTRDVLDRQLGCPRRNPMPQKPRSTRGRFSAQRKRDAVLRLIRGESLDVVAREVGVKAGTLSEWRERFMESGLSGLTKQPKDSRDAQIAGLQRKLGEVTMEKELLNEKINRMEDVVPLVPRWLKT